MKEKEKEKLRKDKEYEEKNKEGGGLFSDFFDRHDQFDKKGGINQKEDNLLNNKRQKGNYTFQRDIEKEEIDTGRLKKSILKQKKPLDEKGDEIVTAEDMEAYKMLKVHFDDPMRNIKQ